MKNRGELYMPIEKLTNPTEYATRAFFDRPANVVVGQLAERVFVDGRPAGSLPYGDPLIIQVGDGETNREYRITEAEAYTPNEASHQWKGKRLAKLERMQPGEVVAFNHRGQFLSFIKTTGGENVFIRGLEDVETGQRFDSAHHVTTILGLQPWEDGRLVLVDEERARFERYDLVA